LRFSGKSGAAPGGMVHRQHLNLALKSFYNLPLALLQERA
jgi:hypothetical protein